MSEIPLEHSAPVVERFGTKYKYMYFHIYIYIYVYIYIHK